MPKLLPITQGTTKAIPGNRIWIELDKPTGAEHGQLQCELANALLDRLSPPGKPSTARFWYSDRKARYNLTVDEAGGFLELADRGHWFNLDKLSSTPA